MLVSRIWSEANVYAANEECTHTDIVVSLLHRKKFFLIAELRLPNRNKIVGKSQLNAMLKKIFAIEYYPFKFYFQLQ